MTECVIVALPREDSQASLISSEKIAHMTLLYLGELDADADTQLISEFVEHAVSQVRPFGASVSHRGILGDDQADVLYLAKNDLESMVRFRSYLLTNEQINRAYNKAYQHPSWTPHVTLGYPDSPAQPIEQTEHLHSYVEFDRIAVWYGDFEGPTFRMTHPDETITEHSMDDIDDFLAHYGVKGMKWGVIRKELRKREGRAAKDQYLEDIESDYMSKFSSPEARKKIVDAARPEIDKGMKLIEKDWDDEDDFLVSLGYQRAKTDPNETWEEFFRSGKGADAFFDIYVSEVADVHARAYEKAIEQTVGKVSPSGIWETVPSVNRDTLQVTFTTRYNKDPKNLKRLRKELEHAEQALSSKIVEFTKDVYQITPKGLVRIDPEEVEHAMDDINDFLAHYGVKGMRWGVRKARDSSSGSRSRKKSSGDSDGDESTKKPSKSKNSLSKYSDDKLSSLLSDLKGPDALSDAELTKLTKRMQLEQSYRELKAKQPKSKSKAEKFLDGAKLLGTTANQLNEFLNTPAGKALQSKLKSKVKK